MTESTPITTRQAQLADKMRVEALMEEYRQETGTGAAAPAPESFLKSEGPRYLVVAELGDQMVGFVAGHRCHNFMRGTDFMMLTDIYVLPKHRRRKAGQSLIAAMKEIGRQRGCEGMSLIINDINNAALVTAARSGFSKHNDLLLTLSLSEGK
jgi:ribosomal protein S18 acetylase RimI-like enzyme